MSSELVGELDRLVEHRRGSPRASCRGPSTRASARSRARDGRRSDVPWRLRSCGRSPTDRASPRLASARDRPERTRTRSVESSSPSAVAASSSSSTAPRSMMPGRQQAFSKPTQHGREARRPPAHARAPPRPRTPSSAASAVPARWLAAPSSSCTRPALRRVVDPELEGGREAAERQRRTPARTGRRVRPGRCSRSPARGRRPGGGREVVGEIGEHAPRSSGVLRPRSPRRRGGGAPPAGRRSGGPRRPVARARA